MKVKVELLCKTHTACPEVKAILEQIGFSKLKDMNKSPSFDICGEYEINNEEQEDKLAEKIFKKCEGKVQTIQITK